MVNSEEFIGRLEKILAYYNHTASSFADKIGVQRSSISHLLTGRNKPSLEFVMKVITSFPEVNLYWLLNGKGTFPATKQPTSITKKVPEVSGEIKTDAKPIEKIIILYTDGSFDTYTNKP